MRSSTPLSLTAQANKANVTPLNTDPTMTSSRRSISNSAAGQSSSSTGFAYNNNTNVPLTPEKANTDRFGYKSIIDKGRSTQIADARFLHGIAKERHADKMMRAKQGRERADEAARRSATTSNLNIDDHYQQLLVEIKKNMRARLEAELLAEVREEVYKRHAKIASEYEAEIKDETYNSLVESLKPVVKADLYETLQDRIKEKLREELRTTVKEELRGELEAEVKAELKAQYEFEGAGKPGGDTTRKDPNSKHIQPPTNTAEEAISQDFPGCQVRASEQGISSAINDPNGHLIERLPEEINEVMREGADEADCTQGVTHQKVQTQETDFTHVDHGDDIDSIANSHARREDSQFSQSQWVPSCSSNEVQIKDKEDCSTPDDEDQTSQPSSRSSSVSSKRSRSSAYADIQRPSKRQKYLPEDEDEALQDPYSDDSDLFEQQVEADRFWTGGSASPLTTSEASELSYDEALEPLPPGPILDLAAQFNKPAPLITESNTAKDPFVIDDDDEEEFEQGELVEAETLVEQSFVSVNMAAFSGRKNDLLVNPDDEEPQ